MKTFTEKEAEDFLEKNNFNLPKRKLIRKKDELKNIENAKIPFPWVMKISSRHIVHKTKIGGTILNIKTKEQAEKALEKLCKIPECEGVLIQEMIAGEEFILGLKKTPEFSLVLMLGKGGTNVEKEKDVSFRIPPIKKEDAEQMISEIKFYDKIKAKVSKSEIIKAILRLSELAEKNPNIQELDINPLIVNKKEAVVVDARISIINSS
jgi:acyl-CoA synthetase (NDP forming)